MAKKTKTKATAIKEPTNGAKETISYEEPYIVRFKIKGVSDLLFHRWNCESIDAKAGAAKNSKAKKTDDIESYVYRNDDGEICIPGEYLRQAIIHSAKFIQDPRSPRKSGMDLFKASIIPLTHLASLGTRDWGYLDRRRCVVQRSGINRTRPAMKAGWEAEFDFMVNCPEYISPELLFDVLSKAGRLVGVADFRPTFGRFQVVSFETLELED